MADYIDKQKALAAIEAEREYMTRRQEWLADHILTHCGYRIIEGMPSADVEPVRRGKWIVSPREEWETFDECICSVCNTVEYFNVGWKKFNYCPNCGARMDGGGKNDILV